MPQQTPKPQVNPQALIRLLQATHPNQQGAPAAPVNQPATSPEQPAPAPDPNLAQLEQPIIQ